MSEESKYLRRGVSASKDEVHAAIKDLDKGLYPNAFCKILPDLAGGDDGWCNIMHADTAGTKTSLAYMYWKETGDLSVWKGIAQDAIVMNLDDMACVGCVDNIIISSTIGRNKHLIPGEVITSIIEGANEFFQNLQGLGVGIKLAGGETADVGDIVRTIDVGYTTFARMKRKEVVVNAIRPGHVIVGLSSFGKSIYEDDYNSGIGSNGLTMARHDVLKKEYGERYPDSFDPNTDKAYVYTGTHKLSDKVDVGLTYGKCSVGQLLLSPTRTYLPVVKEVLAAHRDRIAGIIQNTGGGQTKVLKFTEGVQIIKDNLFENVPVFDLIQKASDSTWREMYQVFNMGHRLEFYTEPEAAEAIIEISRQFGIESRVIGRVEAAESSSVEIRTSKGIFEYS